MERHIWFVPFNPLRTHQFPYKFASRGVFAITCLLFTTCITTCTFLERYFDREAYPVIKKSGNEIKCWPKSPSKCMIHGSQQECLCATSTKQQALSADSATFSNVHVYFFCCYAFLKPFATIWQCTSMFAWSGMRRFRPTGEYVVFTYSSMLCPQRVKLTLSTTEKDAVRLPTGFQNIWGCDEVQQCVGISMSLEQSADNESELWRCTFKQGLAKKRRKMRGTDEKSLPFSNYWESVICSAHYIVAKIKPYPHCMSWLLIIASQPVSDICKSLTCVKIHFEKRDFLKPLSKRVHAWFRLVFNDDMILTISTISPAGTVLPSISMSFVVSLPIPGTGGSSRIASRMHWCVYVNLFMSSLKNKNKKGKRS